MSQLTREERALVETYKGEPGIYSIIDRLSARVEELERKKSCWCDEIGDEPCPLHARENALQDRALFAEANLSSLLSAVEPIEARYQREYEDMHDNDPALVSVKDLRTLSTVAAGIRGGKG